MEHRKTQFSIQNDDSSVRSNKMLLIPFIFALKKKKMENVWRNALLWIVKYWYKARNNFWLFKKCLENNQLFPSTICQYSWKRIIVYSYLGCVKLTSAVEGMWFKSFVKCSIFFSQEYEAPSLDSLSWFRCLYNFQVIRLTCVSIF